MVCSDACCYTDAHRVRATVWWRIRRGLTVMRLASTETVVQHGPLWRPFVLEEGNLTTMTTRYLQERAFQEQFTELLATALPSVVVVDVLLDEVAETVGLFIDRPGDGVNHEICAEVTLAVRDICPDHVLEVGSPGVDRPLRLPEHFRDAAGKQVRLKKAGQKSPIKATVHSADDSSVTFRRLHDEQEFTLQFDEIVRCNLTVSDSMMSAKPNSAAKPGRPV